MNPLLNQELRHINASHLAQLSTIIDEAKAWQDLMKNLAEPLKLTLESIHLIQRQQKSDRSPTLALLNHWAITGRRRPTIKDLITHLRSCQLARAENFVRLEILNERPEAPSPQKIVQAERPKALAAADQEHLIGDEFKFDDLSGVLSRITEDCPAFSFESIYQSTSYFCHRRFDFKTNSGARIGDGRFSSVFLAKTHDNAEPTSMEPRTVAAKLLKSECNMNYLVNEINLARRINHENILELQGIAIGNDKAGQPRFICLIYPYMENGSLLDCLTHGLRCDEMRQIPWQRRVDIAVKVIKGIDYLHTFQGCVIIHRDIKTANILIDSSLEPKLGDFTLVRQLESHKPGETQYSQNIIGTSVYMPPEAFRGDISTKFDIFSFGIVLLELLTGLQPFNDDSKEDLLTHISDKLSDIEDDLELATSELTVDEKYDKFLISVADRRAGDWPKDVARGILKLALKTTETRKRDRPEASEVLANLVCLFNGTRRPQSILEG